MLPSMERTFKIDQLFASTWEALLQTDFIDNIFTATPFMERLFAQDKIKKVIGGKYITERLMYGKNKTVKFIGKGGVIDVQVDDIITTTLDKWCYYTGGLVSYKVDEQQNAGEHQIANMVEEHIQNLKLSLEEGLEEAFIVTDVGNPDAPNGIDTLIATDPTTGTVCGIDSAKYPFWRNQTLKATGKASETLIDDINHLYNICIQGKSVKAGSHIILTSLAVFEALQKEIRAQMKYVPTDENIPFPNIKMGTITVLHSPACKKYENQLRLINLNHLYLVVDPRYMFTMGEWKTIPNQLDRTAQILLVCNLITNNRSVHGVLYDIQL